MKHLLLIFDLCNFIHSFFLMSGFLLHKYEQCAVILIEKMVYDDDLEACKTQKKNSKQIRKD